MAGTIRRRKERGGCYEVTWYDGYGRRRRELLPSTFNKNDAQRVLAKRIDAAGRTKLGLPRKQALAFRCFVDRWWKEEATHGLKPSTRRGYRTLLDQHLLPHFGDMPLNAISRATVKAYMNKKAAEKRASYSLHNPNPNRPNLSAKTRKNMLGLLHHILETAVEEYEVLEANPIHRMRWAPKDRVKPRVGCNTPEEFLGSLQFVPNPQKDMVIVASLTGLRWGELVALQMEEDVDFKTNHIHVQRSFYRRIAQTPKSDRSFRSIDMVPTVRRILLRIARGRPRGLVFSADGKTPIGDGSHVKRLWRKAQVQAGVKKVRRWHDLRHFYASLLIAAGKHPKYTADQMGHASISITMDTYGHLMEELPIASVEWIDDLLYPGGDLVAKFEGTGGESGGVAGIRQDAGMPVLRGVRTLEGNEGG